MPNENQTETVYPNQAPFIMYQAVHRQSNATFSWWNTGMVSRETYKTEWSPNGMGRMVRTSYNEYWTPGIEWDGINFYQHSPAYNPY